MCEMCDAFDVSLRIHGPAQARRVITKLQDAVRNQVLTTLSSRDNEKCDIRFMDLNPIANLPDILLYDFGCPHCDAEFALRLETWHGQGGTWSKRERS